MSAPAEPVGPGELDDEAGEFEEEDFEEEDFDDEGQFDDEGEFDDDGFAARAEPEVERAAPGGAVPASRAYAWLLVIAGAIALAASITLTLEKIRLLENPSYVPSCNINPIISCGSVMRTWQASAFGFLNALIGLAGFSVVVCIGMAMLAGARFRRWFWLGLQAGVLFGIGFVHWLIDQTLYHIGAVCPYCTVVWSCMIPLFWYTTLHNVRRGVIPTPAGWRPGVAVVSRYHWVVPLLWYLAVVLMVLNRFWYYWKTLL